VAKLIEQNIMHNIVRIGSLFIFLGSLLWIAFEPKPRSIFASVVALIMFFVTFLKNNIHIGKALAAVGLLGTGLWAILDFPSLEPMVGFTGALLAYISTLPISRENTPATNVSNEVLPMNPSHLSNKDAMIKKKLEMAKRTLAILEEQASGFTKLTLPAHLQIELEEKRREVEQLEKMLNDPTGN
jgi:hypothetical protein